MLGEKHKSYKILKTDKWNEYKTQVDQCDTLSHCIDLPWKNEVHCMCEFSAVFTLHYRLTENWNNLTSDSGV